MEKLEYYLIGKKFTLISDHKSLEEIHKKKDFGTPRIQRWLERFSRFDFNVCYREGNKLTQADALSRVALIKQIEDCGLDKDVIIKHILKIHEDCGHRKNIYSLAKRSNKDVTHKLVKMAIKECKRCCCVDKKYTKHVEFITTSRPVGGLELTFWKL
ncbi:Retrovirus-related Pol polyprotein from transposon [Dictyocoela roeselum]|nr:Retrovirus-related Pol polyprotein from transposon [Dictyocoela roeselum]